MGLTFDSQLGADYQLQYKESLSSGSYTNAPLTIHGTGSAITIYEPTGSSTQKFWRTKLK